VFYHARLLAVFPLELGTVPPLRFCVGGGFVWGWVLGCVVGWGGVGGVLWILNLCGLLR